MLRHAFVAGLSLAIFSLAPAASFANNEESAKAAAGSPAIMEAARAAEVTSEAKTEANTPPAQVKTAEADKADAPVESAPPPEPAVKVAVDLGSQLMTVREHGTVIHSWPISSGTSEFPTPRGSFRPQWTAKMWYSRKYDNAPMPHAVFINGGVAIHATYHTRMLGRPASHGCIRLAPGNAATFYKLVHRAGLKNVRVSVFGTPKWRSPAVASRSGAKSARYARYSDGGYGYRRSSYGTTSAFDWGFTKPKRRPPVVYYPGDGPRYYYRKPAQRYVYQRPRRYYYSDGW